ncbi:protein kinase domain containing protein [Nitzschia inconspicua]|uniref:Casein kinase I n=1 Tax=Nitzschia inconspicua TaxID=303405 RepID=A0A9K3L181_9STRA|nr:protein kinase domain containing protein [Nitzschia inconspicua]
MSPSPSEIEIVRNRNKFTVGKKIGSGSCAAVYELKDSTGQPTKFAIKVAPLPKKKTKKENSVEEINAQMLSYESMVYQTNFSELQGQFIPSIPDSMTKSDPPVNGEANGYRYFIMERMQAPLTSIVPALLQQKSSSKTISVGPIAVKILECVQAIHRNNVVRDVKTDNFMLAPGGGTGRTEEEKLASRIRLLDLAMTTQLNNMYANTEGAGGMIGTPLYASLNVHEGKKIGRKDDLEAAGYVLAELLIKLSSGDEGRKLPWNDGTSDDEIGAMKRAMVEDPGSMFFQQLGDQKTISVFSKYLTTVRGYHFKDQPDYDGLADILGKLTVPRAKVASKATMTPTKKSPRRQSTRKTGTTSAEEPCNPTKRVRTRTIATQTTPTISRKMDVDEDDVVDDSVDAMDWECVDENNEPIDDDKKPSTRAKREPAKRWGKVITDEKTNRRNKSKAEAEVTVVGSPEESDDSEIESVGGNVARMPARLQRRGVKVSVVAGPHRGESFVIEDGGMETFVLGSKPSSRVGKTYTLSKDKAISDTHVRLDLNLKKGIQPGVTVTNKSKGKTFVNNCSINNTKAFIGNTIDIGNTTLQIDAL